jgi:hypothetical protein
MTKQSIRNSAEEIIERSEEPGGAEPHGGPHTLGEPRSPRLRRAAYLGLLAVSLLVWVGVIWLLVAWLG